MNKKKKKILLPILIILWILIALLTAAAFYSKTFVNWYLDNLTAFRVNTYARFSNLFKISIGEIMITAAIILIVISVIAALLLIFLHRHRSFKRCCIFLFKADILIASIAGLIMTLNCTILYKADPITVYAASDGHPVSQRQYSKDELYILRNYIVDKCNEYSLKVNRGDDGYVVYDGDIQQAAKDAMHKIEGIYPRLSGYYPDVKMMMYSNLMCQAYMEGYYFPFSMEANINSKMYVVNNPEAMCHELSHLHGYIFEDEANFLSFLACTSSDDDFIVYSGYMKVLNYVANAYYPYIFSLDEEEFAGLVRSNELVDKDNIFLLSDTWKQVEQKAIVDTQTVKEASETFTDTALKISGVDDGMASYDRVVELLLQYYDGTLY